MLPHLCSSLAATVNFRFMHIATWQPRSMPLFCSYIGTKQATRNCALNAHPRATPPTVVLAVTKQFSDDTNGPIVDATHVHLQVSHLGPVVAFHTIQRTKKIGNCFIFSACLIPTPQHGLDSWPKRQLEMDVRRSSTEFTIPRGQSNPREVIEFKGP